MSLSKLTPCGHCGNISRMEIIGTGHENFTQGEDEHMMTVDWAIFYRILKCPACQKINFVSSSWHDGMQESEESDYEFLYPQKSNYPLGLPGNVLTAYKAAEKVKSVDVNAYAILIRRLLELICLDREAKSGTLASMLKELADKNEIPQKLVKVASGLKDFGNIGAHAGSGELTENEIPTLSALCNAILEYVYSAPHLATIAENKLNSIKTKAKRK